MSLYRNRSFLEDLFEKFDKDGNKRKRLRGINEDLDWQGARIFGSKMTPEQVRAAQEEKRRLEDELGIARPGHDPVAAMQAEYEAQMRAHDEERRRQEAEWAEQKRAEEEAAQVRTVRRDRWVDDYADRIASHADAVAVKVISDLAAQSNLPRDFDPSIPNLYVDAGHLRRPEVTIVIIDDATDRKRPVTVAVEDFGLPSDVVEREREEAFLQRAFDRAHSSLRAAFSRAYSEHAAGRSLTAPTTDAPAPAVPEAPASSASSVLSAELVADLDQVAQRMRDSAGSGVVFARVILAFMPNSRAVMVDARHEGGGTTMFEVGRPDAPTLSETLAVADPEVAAAAREYVTTAANNL